jgi:hypothetical protein
MARREEEMAVGEDSFLDTTANLVGILIILVVVIGSKTTIDAHEYGKQLAEAEQVQPILEQPAREAIDLKRALVEQQTKLHEYSLETEYRRAERDRLLEIVTLSRQKIEEELEQTDDVKRKSVENSMKLEELQTELNKAHDQIGAADQRERPKVILEHLPTPMAKTVFGRELHLRLQRGLVTVVPWDELVSMLKQQVPLAMRRNSSRTTIEESLGPVGGFLMRYRMTAVTGGFELDRFELETTPENNGEPLESALSSSGRLRLDLSSRDPAQTVVTVWVYPDSFDQFRQLKAVLFDEGFLCAGRPLPEGMRIGASPRGSRSSAQ